jgi:hypothetical protein
MRPVLNVLRTANFCIILSNGIAKHISLLEAVAFQTFVKVSCASFPIFPVYNLIPVVMPWQ